MTVALLNVSQLLFKLHATKGRLSSVAPPSKTLPCSSFPQSFLLVGQGHSELSGQTNTESLNTEETSTKNKTFLWNQLDPNILALLRNLVDLKYKYVVSAKQMGVSDAEIRDNLVDIQTILDAYTPPAAVPLPSTKKTTDSNNVDITDYLSEALNNAATNSMLSEYTR